MLLLIKYKKGRFVKKFSQMIPEFLAHQTMHKEILNKKIYIKQILAVNN